MDEVYTELFWQSTVVRDFPGDPMADFGKWLERHEEENPHDTRHPVELVGAWCNAMEGERQTLTLPGLEAVP